jgi:methylase of polypeptide subunit release factors
MENFDAEQAALLRIGRRLQEQRYQFVTITPASHARVNARTPHAPAQTLRDVFGWSRPFEAGLLDAQVLRWLSDAQLLESAGEGLLRSKVRFSSLLGSLYVHSAYPTVETDAVFFGPDTYRFAALIAAEIAQGARPARGMRILDVGCGAGPGGIVAARAASACEPELLLADISTKALRYAAVNAALANLDARTQFAQGDLFAPAVGQFDLVVANPPYLKDAGQRTYRHGGGEWGEGLSERIVREGLPRLAPGARLVLYTGAAIIEGTDSLLRSLQTTLTQTNWPWSYRELDPDIFGEELETEAYAGAERIAAIALVVRRPS